MRLNEVYCMDNLELLKQLDDNSIDLIYCDILYNTGKKFKDYDDKLGTPQQAVEWYEPRLTEMYRVLKGTGSIYLQCDYRLVHYLKVEMDKIFGYECFKNDIIWHYTMGGSNKKLYSRKHDNILFYTKTETYTFNLNDILIPLSKKTINRSKTEKGRRYKQELNDSCGKNPSDVWTDISGVQGNAREKSDYDTQKPKKLIERIILASSNEGDIVADFFCGSGTTMLVAKELGRNYIGCDINHRAIEITKKRLFESKN